MCTDISTPVEERKETKEFSNVSDDLDFQKKDDDVLETFEISCSEDDDSDKQPDHPVSDMKPTKQYYQDIHEPAHKKTELHVCPHSTNRSALNCEKNFAIKEITPMQPDLTLQVDNEILPAIKPSTTVTVHYSSTSKILDTNIENENGIKDEKKTARARKKREKSTSTQQYRSTPTKCVINKPHHKGANRRNELAYHYAISERSLSTLRIKRRGRPSSKRKSDNVQQQAKYNGKKNKIKKVITIPNVLWTSFTQIVKNMYHLLMNKYFIASVVSSNY